jgi:hypothetical protein
MYVICVSSQAQHGKDTLADRLAELLNQHIVLSQKNCYWTRSAFAKGVKKVYMDTFGRPFPWIEKWKVSPEIPPGFQKNVRQSLQFIGDGFRQIKPTVWVDLALHGEYPVIISDGRYINEFKRVREAGGLNILVGRPDKLNDDPNPSEAEVKPFVVWCLDNLPNPVTFKPGEVGRMHHKPPPEHMELFDVFIRNDRDLEEYYKRIYSLVYPFVEKFPFKEDHDDQG